MINQKLMESLKGTGWRNLIDRGTLKLLMDHPALITQLNLIGSPLYTRAFKRLTLPAAARLRLVLRQVQASIDQNGFLQIKRQQFYPRLPPHADFLVEFRKQVRRAFPAKSLRVYARDPAQPQLAELAGEIHLFRSYLDWQNIRYIRTNFSGQTDFKKLQNYCQLFKIKLDYSTSARFHNRYLPNKKFSYPQNFKIQVDSWHRMSEFILEIDTQKFVTEWDVYRQLTNQLIDSNKNTYPLSVLSAVANTGSFNFGLPKGRWAWLLKFNDTHQRLDVMHPTDPQIRRWLLKRKFRTPSSYRRQGEYIDLIVTNKDFASWQKVPIPNRRMVYLDFCRFYQQSLPARNRGFADYWQQRGNKVFNFSE